MLCPDHVADALARAGWTASDERPGYWCDPETGDLATWTLAASTQERRDRSDEAVPPMTAEQRAYPEQRRETLRRERVARTHGHAAMPYPTPGCTRCEPRVVGPWGTR